MNKNCFYCQSLGVPSSWGKCAFCGKTDKEMISPLYLVSCQGKSFYFCCGCAWWQLPHNKAEETTEDKWYQQRKKELESQLLAKYQQRVKKYFNHAT